MISETILSYLENDTPQWRGAMSYARAGHFGPKQEAEAAEQWCKSQGLAEKDVFIVEMPNLDRPNLSLYFLKIQLKERLYWVMFSNFTQNNCLQISSDIKRYVLQYLKEHAPKTRKLVVTFELEAANDGLIDRKIQKIEDYLSSMQKHEYVCCDSDRGQVTTTVSITK